MRTVISKPKGSGSIMKLPGLRWWVVALLFGAAVLNYVDRQTLSALAPTIQRDLEMTDRDYANIVNFFLIAYTISYLISGRLADRLGTRASMGLFVAFWSVVNMMTAAATGVRSLGAYRFLLGLGEAGVWPAASKAVSEWFPARERALAIGIYTMGATIGATLAPYIVIPIATYQYEASLPWVASVLGNGHGWRLAFILTGAAGLLWLLLWLPLYRHPQHSKLVTKQELAMLETAEEEESAREKEQAWSWKQVFLFKGTWYLLLGRLLSDPVWYFYQFWFPKYLSSDRLLSQGQLTITWMIYAAAGVGSLAGGWLSGLLIRRGLAPAASRMWIMLGCALLMPLSPLIATSANLNVAMIFAVISVAASLAWLINISSLVVDLVPKHSLGTVFSVVAAGSTLGGIVMNMLVAAMVSGPSAGGGFLDEGIRTLFGGLLQMIQGKGYIQWFIIMAFLHPVAWILLKISRVEKL